MSDIYEYCATEFYYPDDLSDTELLQLPTSFENEEKKSKLLTDEEVHNFIGSQQQASTVKKTMYDMNVFQKFLDECGEKRRITEIAPAELDSLLCNFYITAKKMSTEDLSVRKRTRQATGNVQCLASKSLLTGDQQEMSSVLLQRVC